MKDAGPKYKMRMEARTKSGDKYVFESFIERSGTYIQWRYSKNKKWTDYRKNALAQLDQFNLTNRYTLKPYIHIVGVHIYPYSKLLMNFPNIFAQVCATTKRVTQWKQLMIFIELTN